MKTRSILLAVACLVVLAGCTRSDTEPPAASPSDAATSTDRLPEVVTLPDDFPLTDGWPERLDGPLREGVDLPGCEDDSGSAPNATGTDRLSAEWIAAARHRQLTTYDDSDEAISAARRLVGYYRGCPVVVSEGPPLRTVTTVRRGGLGAQSWQVERAVTTGGRPGGSDVVLVVRTGRAVLVDWSGYGARFEDRRTTLIGRQVARALGVIEAACAFTQEDC